ncbi:ferredoxin [Bifidobacterium catenulatum]|nr:ferredoxin [Bifidobacterium catenulatum]
MAREWIEPPDVEPVCPIHGCALYPARPIPCPECEIEAEEEEADHYERD